MSTPFGDVARVWAARRLDVDVREVIEVSFESEDGYAISTHTYEPATTTAVVQLANGRRRIETYVYSFPYLLEELVATATAIGDRKVPEPSRNNPPTPVDGT
jgi:hypothetical protein